MDVGGGDNTERKEMVVYTTILILIIIFGYLIVVGTTTEGSYDDFAKCLNEKGATMYGTDRCSYCNEQKNLFGKSFAYINYINCDLNSGTCSAAGVSNYPTWIIENNKYSGTKSLEKLSSLSGCSLE